MKGSGLTRFHPDQVQKGSGFIQDFTKAAALEGWKGLNTGGFPFVPNIPGAVRGVKRELEKLQNEKPTLLLTVHTKESKGKSKTSLDHEYPISSSDESHLFPKSSQDSTCHDLW